MFSLECQDYSDFKINLTNFKYLREKNHLK